ncbi:hypothetical protein ABPG75_004593 [Micractinium tetrahymenae]
MEVEGGSALHPLMATARSNRWDDSVDMSVDTERRVGEDEETQRVFGTPTVGTQGPAGSRVPDLDDPSRRHPEFGGEEEEEELAGTSGYPEDGDAPPDAVGPRPPVEAEITAEDFTTDPEAEAAAAAVMEARRSGRSGSAAMLDALEAAESAYEQQAAARQAQAHAKRVEKLASLKAAANSRVGAAAAAAAAAAATQLQLVNPLPVGPAEWGAGGGERLPDTPRKAAICEGTREKMVQAVFEALQANPRYGSEPSRNLMHHAQAVEDALFTSSHSKQARCAVYLSKVSNAVRLARSAPDVADIPRIASGEPRAVAEGHTAGEPSPYVSGLTGYVIKPQM